jgi:hypothetical protein
MIQELLRDLIGEAWVERIDLASAQMVSGTFVSAKMKNRESDIIWSFRRRDNGEPVYLYILLEFQSRPDRYMPVRLMSYEGLLYERLIAQGRLPPSGRLPQVIPMVMYNGLGPWGPSLELSDLIERFDPSAEEYIPHLRCRIIHEAAFSLEVLGKIESPVADLFQLERSKDWKDVLQGVSRVRRHVSPEESSLRRAFETWLKFVTLPRLGVDPAVIPVSLTLEEYEPMLAERIDEWNRQVLEKGRQEGRQDGEARVVLRLLEEKFGALDDRSRELVRTADADRLLDWGARILRARQLQDVFGD